MAVDVNELYGILYRKALEGDADCGGLLSYNYFSGEPVTGFLEGRPMFVRKPDGAFHLANFMRTHILSALAAIKIGNDILFREEGVKVDRIMGHGGLFKTPVVGQKLLAAALNSSVTVMDTASEGGAWGIAVLAAYMLQKEEEESLADYLDQKVFTGQKGTTQKPDVADVAGFDRFIESYKAGFAAEHAAAEIWK